MIERDTSPGFVHIPFDAQRIDALRRLLNVAERGSIALSSWPTMDCDSPDRDYMTSLEESYESLKLAMAQVAEAINDLTVSYRPESDSESEA